MVSGWQPSGQGGSIKYYPESACDPDNGYTTCEERTGYACPQGMDCTNARLYARTESQCSADQPFSSTTTCSPNEQRVCKVYVYGYTFAEGDPGVDAACTDTSKEKSAAIYYLEEANEHWCPDNGPSACNIAPRDGEDFCQNTGHWTGICDAMENMGYKYVYGQARWSCEYSPFQPTGMVYPDTDGSIKQHGMVAVMEPEHEAADGKLAGNDPLSARQELPLMKWNSGGITNLGTTPPNPFTLNLNCYQDGRLLKACGLDTQYRLTASWGTLPLTDCGNCRALSMSSCSIQAPYGYKGGGLMCTLFSADPDSYGVGAFNNVWNDASGNTRTGYPMNVGTFAENRDVCQIRVAGSTYGTVAADGAVTSDTDAASGLRVYLEPDKTVNPFTNRCCGDDDPSRQTLDSLNPQWLPPDPNDIYRDEGATAIAPSTMTNGVGTTTLSYVCLKNNLDADSNPTCNPAGGTSPTHCWKWAGTQYGNVYYIDDHIDENTPASGGMEVLAVAASIAEAGDTANNAPEAPSWVACAAGNKPFIQGSDGQYRVYGFLLTQYPYPDDSSLNSIFGGGQTINVNGHGYLCTKDETTGTATWIECGATKQNVGTAGQHVTPGTSVYVSGGNNFPAGYDNPTDRGAFYCADNNQWVNDIAALPDPSLQRAACKASGFTWTGTKCCGDVYGHFNGHMLDEKSETYTDTMMDCIEGIPVSRRLNDSNMLYNSEFADAEVDEGNNQIIPFWKLSRPIAMRMAATPLAFDGVNVPAITLQSAQHVIVSRPFAITPPFQYTISGVVQCQGDANLELTPIVYDNGNTWEQALTDPDPTNFAAGVAKRTFFSVPATINDPAKAGQAHGFNVQITPAAQAAYTDPDKAAALAVSVSGGTCKVGGLRMAPTAVKVAGLTITFNSISSASVLHQYKAPAIGPDDSSLISTTPPDNKLPLICNPSLVPGGQFVIDGLATLVSNTDQVSSCVTIGAPATLDPEHQYCYGVEPNRHCVSTLSPTATDAGFYCSPDGVWSNQTIQVAEVLSRWKDASGDNYVLAEAESLPPFTANQSSTTQDGATQGCCPQGMCLKVGTDGGRSCVPANMDAAPPEGDLDLDTSGNALVCVLDESGNGVWQGVPPKQTPRGDSEGFCPAASDCLLDLYGVYTNNYRLAVGGEGGQVNSGAAAYSEAAQRASVLANHPDPGTTTVGTVTLPGNGNPQCLQEGQFARDYYCEGDGEWQSRTRQLATALINLNSQRQDGYALYCDTPQNVANTISYTFGSAGSVAQWLIGLEQQGIDNPPPLSPCKDSAGNSVPCVERLCALSKILPSDNPDLIDNVPIIGATLNAPYGGEYTVGTGGDAVTLQWSHKIKDVLNGASDCSSTGAVHGYYPCGAKVRYNPALWTVIYRTASLPTRSSSNTASFTFSWIFEPIQGVLNWLLNTWQPKPAGGSVWSSDLQSFLRKADGRAPTALFDTIYAAQQGAQQVMAVKDERYRVIEATGGSSGSTKLITTIVAEYRGFDDRKLCDSFIAYMQPLYNLDATAGGYTFVGSGGTVDCSCRLDTNGNALTTVFVQSPAERGLQAWQYLTGAQRLDGSGAQDGTVGCQVTAHEFDGAVITS